MSFKGKWESLRDAIPGGGDSLANGEVTDWRLGQFTAVGLKQIKWWRLKKKKKTCVEELFETEKLCSFFYFVLLLYQSIISLSGMSELSFICIAFLIA